MGLMLQTVMAGNWTSLACSMKIPTLVGYDKNLPVMLLRPKMRPAITVQELAGDAGETEDETSHHCSRQQDPQTGLPRTYVTSQQHPFI